MILAAFRVRSFRFQWPADLLTSWAVEMETIILGWYVMVQTGSVLWLTAFGSMQFFGTLAAPMFGVLGDRLGGRFMLCVMRATYAVLAAFLMLLALAGLLTPAWVLIVAAIGGVVRPNDQVMRNTLIGETIPREHLMGALGLSRASMDSARVAGALAGAGLSTVLGIGYTYVFVTSFYVASLALTFGIARRLPMPDPTAPTHGSISGAANEPDYRGAPRLRRAAPSVAVRGEPRSGGEPSPSMIENGLGGRPEPPMYPKSSRWRELKDGLVHVVTTPALLGLMLLAFLINLTAYPASSGLLPYVADRVYHVGATGLGWLVAAFSLGGLLASIATVLTGGSRRPERSTLVCTAIWYGLLLILGHVRSLGPGLLILLVAGFVQNVAMISMTATLIAATGEGFRGRVMGVRTLAVYGMPLGLMASGVLIERIGYPLTITMASGIGLIFTLLIGIRWRASMWERRVAEPISAVR